MVRGLGMEPMTLSKSDNWSTTELQPQPREYLFDVALIHNEIFLGSITGALQSWRSGAAVRFSTVKWKSVSVINAKGLVTSVILQCGHARAFTPTSGALFGSLMVTCQWLRK